MKRNILLAVIICLSLLAVLPAGFAQEAIVPPRAKYKHSKKIEVEYDKLRDLTTVRLDTLQLFGMDATALFTYKGDKPAMPKSVSLFFLSVSVGWKYDYDKPHLLAIADGKKYYLGTARRVKGDIRSSTDYSNYHMYVSELLLIEIPTTTFLRFVNANKLKMKLENSESALKDDQVQALRDFASRMQ